MIISVQNKKIMKRHVLPMFAVLAAIVLTGCRPAGTDGQSPPEKQIVKAVADNGTETLRLLLTNDPKLSRTTDDHGVTLLHYAAKISTDPAVLQTLLDFGADPRARDDKDWLPIDYALHRQNKTATDFLLKRKIDGDSYPDTETLIEKAVRWNADAETLNILLEKHRDFWVATRLTLTAARYNDDPEVMRLILERGGDPNAGDGHVTAMHYAAAKSSSTKTLQYLLDRRAKINVRRPRNFEEGQSDAPNTPLHYAAKNNPNVEISQWLIDHGADPFAKNGDGETPCDYAIRYNPNPEVVRFYRATLTDTAQQRSP